jgi:hypothetical protein
VGVLVGEVLLAAMITGMATVLAAMIQRQGRDRRTEHERLVRLLRCHRHDKTGRAVAEILD